MTKRKRTTDSDQPNLKRLRSEVTGISKEQRFQAFGLPRSKTVNLQSRKEKRKEARHLKKLRKLAYSQRKPIPTKRDLDLEKKKQIASEKKEEKLKRLEKIRKEKKKRLAKKKKMADEERRRDREMADFYDDRMIKEMEKKLKLDKRKKDTLPKAFMDDGLDYILDVVGGSSKLKDIAANTDSEDSDSEADRLAMYGLTGDASDDEDEENNEMNDEDEDLNIDSDENDDSDENEAYDGKHLDQAVLKTTDQDKEDIKSILKKTKDGSREKKVKWETDEDNKSTTLKEDRKRKKKIEEESTVFKKQKETKLLKGKIDEESDDDDDDNDDDDDDDDLKDRKQTVEYHSEDEEQEESDNIDNGDDDTADDKDEENDDTDDDDVDDDDDDDGGDSDNDNVYDELDDDKSKEDNNVSAQKDIDDQNLKEDIYGRLRDKEGNIVKPTMTGAYVPPGKRLMMADDDEKKKIQLKRLRKQLKGLVNRASETNIQPISTQIENLYLTNSRADVNETLISLIFDSCVTSILTPERLAMELMMLVAILHGNVGSEVGAVFLQHLVKKFDDLSQLKDYGIGKEMDNVIILLSHLYNFKVVHSVLIFDIVHKLVSCFNERDVELILLVLKHVGFTLRKDDPSGLKSLIQEIQSKASSTEGAALTDQSRVRFMLDVIMAIRNNNMRKIPNYDPEHLEHLRKLIRNYIRGGHFGDNQLHISLEDLLRADEQGKWWVVGSAWSGQGPRQQLDSMKGDSSVISGVEVSSKLQELARKQRMNTDLRRNIFFIIMTSEDYIDAFEKLLRLGLKSSQQQEIVLVILDCCLQEKKYNPFYSYLGQKFCEHHRSFQMAFQFTIWDRFKELGKLSETNRHNLGKLLTHLFATKALSLSIFKVVTFGTLEKPMVRLLKQVLSDLLLEHSQSTTEAVFQRIAQLNKLKMLHEGLRLFLHHFILGKRKEGTNISVLKERVEMVDKIFSSGKTQMLL